jgi:hypothetical protein
MGSSPLVGSLAYAFSEVVNHRRASLGSRIGDALDEVDRQMEDLRAAKS